MPNEEVRQSLSLLEMGALTDTEIIEVENALYQLRYALEHKAIDAFLTTLRGLFASIPYTLLINREAYYHSLFQLLCTLLGFENHCELLTNKGRIDLTVTTAKYLYIFEFKFNKSGKEALTQIKRNGYGERYRKRKREIVLVGVSFNNKNKDLIIDYATSNIN